MQRSLDTLRDGEGGTISRLLLEGPAGRRLIEMGITPGTYVRLRKRAPLGDPIEIELRSYCLMLRAGY